MMADWSAGVEIRNYKIQRRPDSRSLSDLIANFLCILMIAGALVGYLWIRVRIVALGYELQQSKEAEESLTRSLNTLILEEETLKQPERIDRIARNELSMEPLGPYQRIMPRFLELEGNRLSVLELTNSRPLAVPPRRSSANN
jgi:cell division protein FtsL